MHNTESVQENETHKLPEGFKIQVDHLISARRPGQVIVKKKERRKENQPITRLSRSGETQSKTERKQTEK